MYTTGKLKTQDLKPGNPISDPIPNRYTIMLLTLFKKK